VCEHVCWLQNFFGRSIDDLALTCCTVMLMWTNLSDSSCFPALHQLSTEYEQQKYRRFNIVFSSVDEVRHKYLSAFMDIVGVYGLKKGLLSLTKTIKNISV